MNKKMIAAFFAVSMIATMGGCSSSEDVASKAEESITEESIAEESVAKDSSAEASVAEESSSTEELSQDTVSDSEFAFEIVSTSLSKDYNNADVLVVEYNYTNNSDKATSFTFACQDKVFQNGIECDSTVIGCDEVDTQTELNDIQPGTTYTLKVGYHLQDTTTPVQIQVTDLFGTETFIDETITL